MTVYDGLYLHPFAAPPPSDDKSQNTMELERPVTPIDVSSIF